MSSSFSLWSNLLPDEIHYTIVTQYLFYEDCHESLSVPLSKSNTPPCITKQYAIENQISKKPIPLDSFFFDYPTTRGVLYSDILNQRGEIVHTIAQAI